MFLPVFKIPRIRRRMIEEIVRKHQLKTAARTLSRAPKIRTLTLEDFLLPQMEINIQKDAWYLQNMKVTVSQPNIEEIKNDQVFIDDFENHFGDMDEDSYLEYIYGTFDFKPWFLNGWEGLNPGKCLLNKYIPPTQELELHWDALDVYDGYSSTLTTLHFQFNGDPLYDNPDSITEKDFLNWVSEIKTEDETLLYKHFYLFRNLAYHNTTVNSGVKGVIVKPFVTILYTAPGIFIKLKIEWTFFKPKEEGDS